MHGGSLPPLKFGRELVKQAPLAPELAKRPPLERTTSSGPILRSHGPEFPELDFLQNRFEEIWHDHGATFARYAKTFNEFKGALTWLHARGFDMPPAFIFSLIDASNGGPQAVGARIDQFVAELLSKACQSCQLLKPCNNVNKAEGRNALMRFMSRMLVDPDGRINPTAVPHLQRLIWHVKPFDQFFDRSWLEHLSNRFADLGHQHSALSQQLNSFASIDPLSPVGERIVRLTLNKPGPGDLTGADRVETALLSALHDVGQPHNLGSCAVSSLAIKVHRDDPVQFLREFHEVLSAGTVPFGKGTHDIDHVEFNETSGVPAAFQQELILTPDYLRWSRSIACVLDQLGVSQQPEVRQDLFVRSVQFLPAAPEIPGHRKGSIHEIAHMLVLSMHETRPDQLRDLRSLESNARLLDGLQRDLQRTSDESKIRKLSAKVKAITIAQGDLAKPFEEAGIDWRERLDKIQAQQLLADQALAAHAMPPGLMGWSLTMSTEVERFNKEMHWGDIEKACTDKVQRSNPAARAASRKILQVARQLYLERVSFRKDAALGNSIMFIQTPETAGRGARIGNEGEFARVLGDLLAEAAGKVARDQAGAEAGAFLAQYGRSREIVESLKKSVSLDPARKELPTEPWFASGSNHQGFDDGVSLITRGVRQPRAYNRRQLSRQSQGRLAPGELLVRVIRQGQLRRQAEGAGAGLTRARASADSHAFNLLIDHPSTAGAMNLGPRATEDWIRKELEEPARRELAALRNVPSLRQVVESMCSAIPFTVEQKKAFVDAVCRKAEVPGAVDHYTLKRLVRAFRDQLPRTGIKGSLADFEDSARASLCTFNAFEPKLAIVADTNWRDPDGAARLMGVGFDFLSEDMRLLYVVERHDMLQGRSRQYIEGLAAAFERERDWRWENLGAETQPPQ